jgi:general secretion pathway protein G
MIIASARPRFSPHRAFLRRSRRRIVRSHPDRGFTLLEVMIVLAIIGLISAAIGTGVMHSLHESRLRTAKLQVREIVGSVQQSMLDDTACPTIDDLVKRGALRNSPKDPWGTPLVLHCPSEHEKDPVDVISAGPDKKPGNEDDIRSWEL